MGVLQSTRWTRSKKISRLSGCKTAVQCRVGLCQGKQRYIGRERQANTLVSCSLCYTVHPSTASTTGNPKYPDGKTKIDKIDLRE